MDVLERIPLTVVQGDEVIFDKFAGTVLAIKGVDHMVLREREILAVDRPDKEKHHERLRREHAESVKAEGVTS